MIKLGKIAIWVMLIITDILVVVWGVHDVIVGLLDSYVLPIIIICLMAGINVLCYIFIKSYSNEDDGDV